MHVAMCTAHYKWTISMEQVISCIHLQVCILYTVGLQPNPYIIIIILIILCCTADIIFNNIDVIIIHTNTNIIC